MDPVSRRRSNSSVPFAAIAGAPVFAAGVGVPALAGALEPSALPDATASCCAVGVPALAGGSEPSLDGCWVRASPAVGADVVLVGHDHDYERINPVDGVSYVVTGGGGYSVRRVGHSDFTAFAASAFHFIRGEIQRDELYLEAIDASGAVIDATHIPRVAPGGAR